MIYVKAIRGMLGTLMLEGEAATNTNWSPRQQPSSGGRSATDVPFSAPQRIVSASEVREKIDTSDFCDRRMMVYIVRSHLVTQGHSFLKAALQP